MTQATPSALFGPLFVAVQAQRLFPDSKTFADAVPKRAPHAILADWQAVQPVGHDALRRFVDANFEVPQETPTRGPAAPTLRDYIDGAWSALVRDDRALTPGDASLLALPRPYVVPGGRFRELYYWDSYFTMLGLQRSGRHDLVEDMILDFGDLIDRYGHVPNGTRRYYLTRSHPPMFYLMTRLSADRSADARRRRLDWLRREHAFWMAGADELAPGQAHRRAVRMADGSLLNRYWDDSDAPRDESWREDVELARANPRRNPQELWRDLRAAAESGWDFSSRWLGDGASLGTIRTTRLIPIDLNALLYGLERTLAEDAAELGDADAETLADQADARRVAIARHLWNPAAGHYADCDLDTGRPTDTLTGASAFPLFVEAADAERAAATANALERLLRPGGLMVSERCTGQQWDAPNGWAPLQWVAIEGLRSYGADALARVVSDRWVAMVEDHYAATGELVEKYDVERRTGGGGGEYGLEVGFGWTNGVTLALLERHARP